MKLAILIDMMLGEYQDVGMQMSCGRKLSYEGLTDHILGMANQEAQLSRPVPMDTNNVDVQPENQGLWCEWGVDAVSMNTECDACQGYGHLARDCPMDKKKIGKGEEG